MSTDPSPRDPRALWQGQPAQGFRMSPIELGARVARAHRTLRLLTVAQYVGSAVSLAGWGAIAVGFDDPFMRAGALLAGLAFVHLLHGLWDTRRAREAARRAAGLAEPSLAYYRADLVRQRDLHSGRRLALRFALAIPAACVFLYGLARAYPALARYVYLEGAAVLVVLPVAFVLGRRRGRALQRRIDELDALRRQA